MKEDLNTSVEKLAKTDRVLLDLVMHQQSGCVTVEKRFGLVKMGLNETLSKCKKVTGDWMSEIDNMEMHKRSE